MIPETAAVEDTDLARRRGLYVHLNAFKPDVAVERPYGKIVIISYDDDYEGALAKFPKTGDYEIVGISFLWENLITDLEIHSEYFGQTLKVIPLNKLKGYVYAKKFVSYSKREPRIETQYFRTRRILFKIGITQFYILETERDFITATRFVCDKPERFKKNADEFARVYHSLDSYNDREIYARYIMGMLTRNRSYTRQTQPQSYYRPEVLFQKGDIVLDAGVSGDIGSSQYISERCGDNGKIFGFEPDRVAFDKAREALLDKKLDNYELIPDGLFKAPSKAYIVRGTGRSAVISTEAPKSETLIVEECTLTSIDHFVKQRSLPRVDAIKMDIEGAELDALLGATATIKTFKPKLYISIYHDLSHLYKIPLLIKELNPNYKFYLEQHSWNLYDLTLFAINIL